MIPIMSDDYETAHVEIDGTEIKITCAGNEMYFGVDEIDELCAALQKLKAKLKGEQS